ncbi:hypothetical protein HWV62_31873 [Athelia sp. TMB]|nr:hypothetical protein HWV62_31873 [Athelia sp. TMB]
MTTINDPRFDILVRDITDLVSLEQDEHKLTTLVAKSLRAALADGITLPKPVTLPHTDNYVMYPLHIDPSGRFSIASAVWNTDQVTPVHSHETWGVVGIYSGAEHERGYVRPQREERLVPKCDHMWTAGQVTVSCGLADQPCIGIHIYGANIGTLLRYRFDAETGKATPFVSKWSYPAPTA